MKSIEKRFNHLKEKYPDWSSIVCFNEAILKQGFSEKSIYFWFSKLVDKNDYQKSDQKDILSFSLITSKRAEEGIKRG
jgi:hypothetical protein